MNGQVDSIWIFGYGSLIWGTSGVELAERIETVLPEWHREWTWISGTRHGAPTCSLCPGGHVKGVCLRLNPLTAAQDLEVFRSRERRNTERLVHDLPVIGATTHFWTMGSNLAGFAELKGLDGYDLAKALARRARQTRESGPDGVSAEEYIARVHRFDPDDPITAAMFHHLQP